MNCNIFEFSVVYGDVFQIESVHMDEVSRIVPMKDGRTELIFKTRATSVIVRESYQQIIEALKEANCIYSISCPDFNKVNPKTNEVVELQNKLDVLSNKYNETLYKVNQLEEEIRAEKNAMKDIYSKVIDFLKEQNENVATKKQVEETEIPTTPITSSVSVVTHLEPFVHMTSDATLTEVDEKVEEKIPEREIESSIEVQQTSNIESAKDEVVEEPEKIEIDATFPENVLEQNKEEVIEQPEIKSIELPTILQDNLTKSQKKNSESETRQEKKVDKASNIKAKMMQLIKRHGPILE